MFQDVVREPGFPVFLAIFMTAFSGVPGLFLRRTSAGQRLATLVALIASGLALPAVIGQLLTRHRVAYLLDWNLPFGPCQVTLDPLSLYFLIPIFLVYPLGSLYANGYWPAAKHKSTQPALTFFYGLLAASMAMVAVAGHGVLFLVSWEVMALSGFFLLVVEHEEPEVRKAGVIYLIASHLGAAGLTVLFSLLSRHTGSFLFPETGRLVLAAGPASVLFGAALLGFGSKAGLMPLHIWLPAAHANAPSHVSALLSGVMLKMGIYGLLRVLSFFPSRPLWWGGLLLGMGLVSALLGIALASAQRDLKRLLAYSSIENLGIIAAGIGAAVMAQSLNHPRLAFFGLIGALFHVLNHAFFKPLLFFGAGSIMHAVGSREIDLMGGLSPRMPRTAFLCLVGSVAICGLPPFNGFASEFLLYLGFFGEATGPTPYLALAAPVLALVGGVAVVSFVKLYGMVFLGAPHSDKARSAHESGGAMLLPMGVLALLCAGAGVFPSAFTALALPVLPTVVPAAAGFPGPSLSPWWFAWVAGALLAVGGGLALFLKGRVRRFESATGPTWGCGYLAPTARMQYTGTSFSSLFTSFFRGVIRTRVACAPVSGVAPASVRLSYRPEETLLERVLEPLFSTAGTAFSFLMRVQHGQVQIYICYIFATLLLLMLWVH